MRRHWSGDRRKTSFGRQLATAPSICHECSAPLRSVAPDNLLPGDLWSLFAGGAGATTGAQDLTPPPAPTEKRPRIRGRSR